MLTQDIIQSYQRDGVALIPGMFADYVDQLRAGIAENLQHPGPYAAENLHAHETGRFFDDYCNWTCIDNFAEAIKQPHIAEIAAELMQSRRVQMFHDHVLVKEPGTSKPTPWHSDGPYYFISGQQNVSFWVPLDPVAAQDNTLRLVAGSHKWSKPVLPTRWLSETNFYPPSSEKDSVYYQPVPDPDREEGMEVLEFDMQPGDAVAFHFNTLHGARGNRSVNRRRVFSLRLLGDDARYIERPGPTSPPFPGHNMRSGDKLRNDWFPILLDRGVGDRLSS